MRKLSIELTRGVSQLIGLPYWKMTVREPKKETSEVYELGDKIRLKSYSYENVAFFVIEKFIVDGQPPEPNIIISVNGDRTNCIVVDPSQIEHLSPLERLAAEAF